MSECEVTLQQVQDLLTDDNGLYCCPTEAYNQVFPGLYIGNGDGAKNVYRLKSLGITHVLNAAEGHSFMHVDTCAEFYAGTEIIYHGFPAIDSDLFDISIYFEDAADFIEKALAYKNGKGRVYVHCKEGYSRAPTLVIAYLMLRHNMDIHTAVSIVQQKRNIGPNDGFLVQLCQLNQRLARQ
ncbi:dual specificity protein phosphatase 3b [Thalassophryne amazonica]|uniref:dual specificity protein phosphatase 3b n=1 Tax=Thalassophryne amazonica TaxID=390379 RepID=UPI001470FD1F|nr:dual specificity protein phosphatase 3b [Thalassophryne amazonica]